MSDNGPDNLSDTSSDSGGSSQNDSEYNFITNFVLEDERIDTSKDTDLEEPLEYTYDDEPLADDEWVLEYQEQVRKQEKRQEELERRLQGMDPVQTWCKCGNCDVKLLQNASECVCCQELEQCVDALNDELVLEDVSEPSSCITLHPGFRPVCLEKWSLRVSADKYKRRDRTRYKQKGSEAKFLRSVAYRTFTYLVHGFLGDNRIALPACAYNAIRSTFSDEEGFEGFEEEI